MSTYIPIDQRDPASIRAAILARSSDPGAKPEDMTGQVEQCREFIARMGWPVVPEAYVFTESKSGMRNVAREVLEAVLKLAITGEIDVIVCREFERVDRIKMRRYQAIQTALDYGVEFRFANIPPDGRLPDDPASRMYRAFLEEYGQMEAERIADRLGPEKLRRLIDGLPHGGRAGPLYGYAPGERREGKHGKPLGLLTWVIDEEKARHVRWLYDTVDATLPQDLSLRDLTRQVERRGIPTATGTGRWSAKQVYNLLTNPKYCGEGRNARYYVEHVQERDEHTGRVSDVTHVHPRSGIETYPTVGIPPIIPAEQFARVQEKLAAAAALRNRGEPRREDAAAHSTLLDGGFVRCAECGGKMTRYWDRRGERPYYLCNKNAGVPTHPHRPHEIRADAVDALALRLFATVLTDPEKILELADAAERQYDEATTDAALAAADLVAQQKRLTEIATEQDQLVTALHALSAVPGMDEQIAAIRAKLAKLDTERDEAKTAHSQAIPRNDHAIDRQAMLDMLRHGAMFISWLGIGPFGHLERHYV
jgi:DNA invertase Pin-like site-specific DNA recombinase